MFNTPLTKERLSSIGFGCWGLSEDWGKGGARSNAFDILNFAWQSGITLFDTANVYGNGFGETMLGKMSWIKDAVISTKISAIEKPSLPIRNIENYYSRKTIISQTENSLRNLNRDIIDIVQLHNWYPEWNKSAKMIFEILNELKEKQYVKNIGISIPNWSKQNVYKLIEMEVLDTIQVPFNLLEQWSLKEIIVPAKKNNICVLSRSPLYHGALSVLNLDDLRNNDPRKEKFSCTESSKLSQATQNICAIIGISKEQLPYYAISYCLSHFEINHVLVGMRLISQIRKNLDISNYNFTVSQLNTGKVFELLN